MIRLGLRDSLLLLTLIPTLLLGLLLGGYFTANRYLKLDELLLEKSSNIITPLSVTLEHPLKAQQTAIFKDLIQHTYDKHSPFIHTIELFNNQGVLQHSSRFHQLEPELTPLPNVEQQQKIQSKHTAKHLVLYMPIFDFKHAGSPTPPFLGTLAIAFNKQDAVIAQQRTIIVHGAIIILAVLIATLISLRLSYVFTRQLRRLVIASRHLSQNEPLNKIDKPMHGELEQLRQGLLNIEANTSQEKQDMQQHIDQITDDYQATLEQYETQNIQFNHAKKEAQSANEVKSEFLAKMSHELRTPLNGVIGFTRQLYKTPLNRNQKEYLDTITFSANTLMTIISDILDFSKLEAKAMVLEKIQFQLKDEINEVLTLLAPSAHEKQLELSLFIQPQVPDFLIGDPTRLKQILTNLVSNAIKFTECNHSLKMIIRDNVKKSGNKWEKAF